MSVCLSVPICVCLSLYVSVCLSVPICVCLYVTEYVFVYSYWFGILIIWCVHLKDFESPFLFYNTKLNQFIWLIFPSFNWFSVPFLLGPYQDLNKKRKGGGKSLTYNILSRIGIWNFVQYHFLHPFTFHPATFQLDREDRNEAVILETTVNLRDQKG